MYGIFKTVRSAVFWTLLHKFRLKLSLIGVLILASVMAGHLYDDVALYLKDIEKVELIRHALIAKWGVIFGSFGYSLYVFFGLFAQGKDKENELKIKEEALNKKEKELNEWEKNLKQMQEKYTKKERLFGYLRRRKKQKSTPNNKEEDKVSYETTNEEEFNSTQKDTKTSFKSILPKPKIKMPSLKFWAKKKNIDTNAQDEEKQKNTSMNA